MDRREFVTAVGAAGVLASTSLAGCVGDVLDEVGVGGGGGGQVSEGETATYNDWVGPATTLSDGRVSVSSLGGAALGGDSDGNAEENDRVQDDPLAMVLLEWAVQIGFISRGVETEGLTDPTADGAGTDRFHYVSGTRVLEGEYDTARLASAQENPDRVEEYGDYTLYVDGGTTVAVADETVLFAMEMSNAVADATRRVEAHIDAAANDGARYAAEHEGFDDLQSALPNRGYSGIEFDPDGGVLEGESNTDWRQIEDTGLDPDVLGYAGSSAIDEDDLTASVAIRYPDADVVDDRETIESALGAEADERAIEIDGPLVIVEGEYTDLSED